MKKLTLIILTLFFYSSSLFCSESLVRSRFAPGGSSPERDGYSLVPSDPADYDVPSNSCLPSDDDVSSGLAVEKKSKEERFRSFMYSLIQGLDVGKTTRYEDCCEDSCKDFSLFLERLNGGVLKLMQAVDPIHHSHFYDGFAHVLFSNYVGDRKKNNLVQSLHQINRELIRHQVTLMQSFNADTFASAMDFAWEAYHELYSLFDVQTEFVSAAILRRLSLH